MERGDAMQTNLKQALIAYGLRQLADRTGGNLRDLGELRDRLPEAGVPDESVWEAYERVLAGDQKRKPEEVLTCIFSLIEVEKGQRPEPCFYSALPLALDGKVLFPKARAEAQPPGHDLWQAFTREFPRIPQMEDEPLFETFYHVYQKYAWAVPCSYGEPGVSLFEQWKGVAALACASGDTWAEGPADRFTLIGGDIPGIQDFVYTITSKGAAKGLRGRSFFLQLLGDAVVRRILADLDLSLANVVYNAGGNFVLLGPEKTQAAEIVERVRRQVNARLVEAVQGDTALVLEAKPVSAADLFTPGRFTKVRDEFGQQVARAKNRPLQELAVDKGDWKTLFEPKGKGSRLSCAVCRIEVDERNSKPLEQTGEVPEGLEPPRICYLCDSFGQLAYDIRHEPLRMLIKDASDMLATEMQPKDGWTNLLGRMTGFRYELGQNSPKIRDTPLAINQLEFLESGAQGFRLLANVTPVVTEDDLEYLREEEKLLPKDMPEAGDIRSFTLLAHAAAEVRAIERVGVLRMDVDGLGWIFSEGMPELTLPRLSALSGALELFFGGYLNRLVLEQAENDLYIIYAGGDDLFIVGAWHHLPDLAETIQGEFKAFTGGHPKLSLSGGITLEGARFPLYRAAERAGEAEGRAKGYSRADGQQKDALCFLDTVVGWEDWALVRDQKDELLWLVGARDNPQNERRLPRTLLQVVQSIFQLYRTGLRDARRRVRQENRQRPTDKKLPLPNPQMFYGRWAWMKVYSLTRLARQHQTRVPDGPTRVAELQRQIMQPRTVRYSGLATRWVEYLTRRSEYV
jgi:CRISPR-associated protein Csm1